MKAQLKQSLNLDSNIPSDNCYVMEYIHGSGSGSEFGTNKRIDMNITASQKAAIYSELRKASVRCYDDSIVRGKIEKSELGTVFLTVQIGSYKDCDFKETTASIMNFDNLMKVGKRGLIEIL